MEGAFNPVWRNQKRLLSRDILERSLQERIRIPKVKKGRYKCIRNLACMAGKWKWMNIL